MPYATRADIETHFGKVNVDEWADLDNTEDETVITARITWALSLAESMVNGWLANSIYETPFTTADDIVTSLTARQAGIILHDLRGMTDGDDMNGHREWINMTIKDLRSGKLRLSIDPEHSYGPGALE